MLAQKRQAWQPNRVICCLKPRRPPDELAGFVRGELSLLEWVPCLPLLGKHANERAAWSHEFVRNGQ